MQFTDIVFLFAFPIACIVYFLIPKIFRKLMLLIISCLFIFSWSGRDFIFIAAETVFTYFAALFIEHSKKRAALSGKDDRRAAVMPFVISFVGIAAVLFVFIYFKYTNFFLSTIHGISGDKSPFEPLAIIAPVGISFYSLQMIGYICDVCKGKCRAEINIINYSLFTLFFTNFLSGPIERSTNLLKQLKAPNTAFDDKRVRLGLQHMLWGYFLKLVIADRATVLVNQVFDEYTDHTGIELLVAAVMFSIQLYADFAGYSYTALGAAKIFGFDIIQNFREPYFAETVGDFWHRWHVSLSTFLRDYVYIPLGGNRKGKARKYLNLMVTFVVSGFWHGAAWTFVFWGVLHGAFQIAGNVLQPVSDRFVSACRINRNGFSYHFFRKVRTFALVTIAWIFFRSETFSQATYVLTHIFDFSNYGTIFSGRLYDLGLETVPMNILLFGIIILFVRSLIAERRKESFNAVLNRQGWWIRFIYYWLLVGMIALSLSTSSVEFIYMQF